MLRGLLLGSRIECLSFFFVIFFFLVLVGVVRWVNWEYVV